MSSTPAVPPPSGTAALLSLRVLAGALMSAVVFMTLALYFVLGIEDDAYTVTALLLGPVALALASHGIVETVGYRLPAIAPGTPREQAEQQSRMAVSSSTVMRFAVCEAVVIVSIAAAFVVAEGGFLLFLVGAVLGLGLLWWHVWPDRRVLARCRTSLEREGAQSFLFEAYGLTPPLGGAIKEF